MRVKVWLGAPSGEAADALNALGFEPSHLDADVTYNEQCELASSINNGGIESQIDHLASTLGADVAEQIIRQIVR